MPTVSPSFNSIFNLAGDVDKATFATWANAVETILATVPTVPVTNAQLDVAPAETVKGNATGTSGAVSDIDMTALKVLLNLSTSDITGFGPLANVAEVDNSIMADMDAGTVKANISGSAAVPDDVTLADLVAVLPLFAEDLRGLVPAPNATDIANNRFLRADGVFSNISGAGLGDVTGPSTTVDREIALWDGTTGTLLKSGPVLAAAIDPFLAATSLQAARGALEMPDVNLLINGDFQINQRAFAGGALASTEYGYDRWKADGATATHSVSGYTLTLTSGKISQIVEASNFGLADFASQNITVSVEDPSADITVTVNGTTGTITAGSGRRGVTIAAGAGVGNMTISLEPAAGAATCKRVKAEVGSVVTGWRARSRAEELRLCYWYFQRQKPISSTFAGFGHRQGTPYIRFGMTLPSVIRTISSLTTSSPAWATANPSGNQIAAFNLATGAYVTVTGGLTFTNQGANQGMVQVQIQAGTSFSTTAGDAVLVLLGGTASIDISAEL